MHDRDFLTSTWAIFRFLLYTKNEKKKKILKRGYCHVDKNATGKRLAQGENKHNSEIYIKRKERGDHH